MPPVLFQDQISSVAMRFEPHNYFSFINDAGNLYGLDNHTSNSMMSFSFAADSGHL